MDLLEITNNIAEQVRLIKERRVRDCGCECELATMVHIYRDGLPAVGLHVEDEAAALGFRLAVTLFNAEHVTISMDGISLDREREELMTLTADAATGELMWKIQPYATAGHMLILPGAEVPDELPLRDPGRIQADITEILEAPRMPWRNLVDAPTDEIGLAQVDIDLAKGLKDKQDREAFKPLNGIYLYARANSSRREVLDTAGLPTYLV